MDRITVTVPLIDTVIIATIEYLNALLISIGPDTPELTLEEYKIEGAPTEVAGPDQSWGRVPASLTSDLLKYPSEPAPDPDEARVWAESDLVKAGYTDPDPAKTFGDCTPLYTATGGADLDSDGVPWDRRIHASTKTKKKTGQWKALRGVDSKLYESVMAELRAAMSAPPVASTAANAMEILALAAVNAPPAPQAAVDAPANFAELTKYCLERKIATSRLNVVAKEVGLPMFALLASRADLIPAFYAKLRG